MKKTLLWFSIVVGLQLAWIFGTATVKEVQLRSGTTVLLETAPVDPRDLLRGDYVILSYKISRISRTLMPVNALPPQTKGANASAASDSVNGRDIYVVLEKRGEFHEAVAASFERPEDAPGQLIVHGKVHSNRWLASANGDLNVQYGIERYYIREGTGNPRGKLTVKASVSPDGTLLIREVYIDGKPYAQVMGQK